MIKKIDKPLIQTNPYLLNPRNRKTQFSRAVVTSTKVEGVTISPSELTQSNPKTIKRK